jgi:hypothetical protein
MAPKAPKVAIVGNVKSADVVELIYREKGKNPAQAIPPVLKLGWHGDSFELVPGKSIRIERAGAEQCIGQIVNCDQHVPDNPVRNVVLEIVNLEAKEDK